jgi:acyl-CoA synthetase (NDP forming)
MTPKQRDNLDRLLNPRHIAVIGGRDAEVAAGECARIGFTGAVWPVNPRRDRIAGHRCFATVEDLPEAPDAVFLAISRDKAIDVVAALEAIGAGGVVCYSAGFGETGSEGAAAENALIAAAGELALVGPNCYGVLNYVDRAALWPFAHGGASPGYGAAIITQSGMLSSDLTMSQRGLPFAYMISTGNQTLLRVEDFIDVLCEKPEVRAIGVHLEGVRDIAAFETAALKALQHGVPVVALKTGSSKIGATLTVSHTGSLSGTDDLYRALFDRLAIIPVSNPAQLLETLKFLCVAGVPAGRDVAGFTCSGGGATMLADYAENIGLSFPAPGDETARHLQLMLPNTATVSNPLDYTTPIWGDAERLPPVFAAALAETPDCAVLVQDYPLPGLDESKPSYLSDARCFIDATRAACVPAAICSTLPENMDSETRDLFIAEGVAPMQGIHETLDAVAAAAWYGERRRSVVTEPPAPLIVPPVIAATRPADEWEGKNLLRSAGLNVPQGQVVAADEAPAVADALGFPVAVKIVDAGLAHKSEVGAVVTGLRCKAEVAAAVKGMRADVAQHEACVCPDRILVERMIDPPVAELMVGIMTDSQFGAAMTLASGGVLVELVADAATILLPAPRLDIERALDGLKISALLAGYRGRPKADRALLVDDLMRLGGFALDNIDTIAELEINPLFILPDRNVAVDALVSFRSEPGADQFT